LPQPSSSVSTPAFFAAALARKMAGAPVSRIMLNGPLPFTFTRTRTCLVSVSRYGTSYFLASLAAAGGSAAHDGPAASSPQRPTAVAPMNPKIISLVVCSPKLIVCGGWNGLFGFFDELSYTPSTSIRVPAFARIGSLNQYVSCQL